MENNYLNKELNKAKELEKVKEIEEDKPKEVCSIPYALEYKFLSNKHLRQGIFQKV